MRSFYTIVNPAAGGGRCGKRAPGALDQLRAAGHQLDVYYTRDAGHGLDLARDAYRRGQRKFLAVGGDGTSFEVINGIFPRADGDEDRVTLAMLPLGTGNSFLRDFGIASAEAALDAIKAGRTHPCDVIRADHADGAVHYINLLGLGFSATAGALSNGSFKRFGAAGYALAVLASLARLRYPTYCHRVDDGDVDRRPCTLLSFSNSRYTAGTMMMAPSADVADGQLDIVRVGALGRARFVRTFPSIFQGTHVSQSGIEQTRAHRVEFVDTSCTDVMVDGEVLRLELHALEVLPQALTVVA